MNGAAIRNLSRPAIHKSYDKLSSLEVVGSRGITGDSISCDTVNLGFLYYFLHVLHIMWTTVIPQILELQHIMWSIQRVVDVGLEEDCNSAAVGERMVAYTPGHHSTAAKDSFFLSVPSIMWGVRTYAARKKRLTVGDGIVGDRFHPTFPSHWNFCRLGNEGQVVTACDIRFACLQYRLVTYRSSFIRVAIVASISLAACLLILCLLVSQHVN